MATTASGREYNVLVGKQDADVLALGGDGDIAATDFVDDSPYFMRLSDVSGINYDDAFTTATVKRSGRRAYEDGDLIRHYGSGTWTWDFDYLVENNAILETLVSLATGVADTTGTITINSAAHDAFENLSHGQNSVDNVGIIMLEAGTSNTGLDADDTCMHSAVLQNLTLAMDMGTDGGRLHASGQFMSGYKPLIDNHGVTGVTTASDWEKGLFDFTTLTLGGHAVTVRAFTMTITNEANRVGWQGTSAEADGYMRAGTFDISGSITVKYDANMADALSTDWIANTAYAIALNDGSNWDISIPSARMTGHNIDFADEGMFVEIPWTATTGAAASGNLAVLKVN